VALAEVLVDGELVASDGRIEVPPGRRALEVRYTALSFLSPERLTFRYRLTGLEPEWVLAGTRRQAVYARLPPGRYRFEVQAASRDGTWGAVVATPVRALPLFWETVWFRALAAAGALGAVVAALRRSFRTLRQEQTRQRAFARRFIEGQETERRRIAAELHDSIGQGLLVAKNRAALALRSPGVGDDARRHLDEIAAVMSETLETAREIAHNLRPHELDRLGLAIAVRTAVEQASSPATAISAMVDPVDDLLGPDAKINLYRIVQEALSNVLKHAGATRARVVLRRERGAVRLTVADNGSGFPPELKAPGFGLSSIAQRVALLGGSHEVVSAPGSGTSVVVIVPLSPLESAP
jgi:signal transduction histidine kinase